MPGSLNHSFSFRGGGGEGWWTISIAHTEYSVVTQRWIIQFILYSVINPTVLSILLKAFKFKQEMGFIWQQIQQDCERGSERDDSHNDLCEEWSLPKFMINSISSFLWQNFISNFIIKTLQEIIWKIKVIKEKMKESQESWGFQLSDGRID